MKAIMISGSPRKNGNTETLLRGCSKRLEEAGIATEFVSVQGKTIKPCTACGTCRKTEEKTCGTKDDDFHGIFESMKRADIIVVGSPVYFGSATPQIMSLLDRAGYVSRANGNTFSRKIGGPVVVARRAGQNFTYAQLLYWYMINDMIVPGSTYWNISFGKAPGDVENDREGLETLDRFTDNLIWLANKLL